MTTPQPRGGARFFLTLGLAAMFGGLWLFLDAQEIGIPPFKRLWPAMFVLIGIGSLLDYFKLSRRPSAAGWAVFWFGLAALGLTLTLGYTGWDQVLNWLPGFPVILGFALLTTWLADQRRNEHYVIAGATLIGLGLMGFMARFDILKKIIPSAQILWAVLLLGVGGYLVFRAVRRMQS